MVWSDERRSVWSRSRSRSTSWSPGEVSRLRDLALQGISLKLIGAQLRRTESAVRNKAGMLGISLQRSGKPESSTPPAQPRTSTSLIDSAAATREVPAKRRIRSRETCRRSVNAMK